MAGKNPQFPESFADLCHNNDSVMSRTGVTPDNLFGCSEKQILAVFKSKIEKAIANIIPNQRTVIKPYEIRRQVARELNLFSNIFDEGVWRLKSKKMIDDEVEAQLIKRDDAEDTESESSSDSSLFCSSRITTPLRAVTKKRPMSDIEDADSIQADTKRSRVSTEGLPRPAPVVLSTQSRVERRPMIEGQSMNNHNDPSDQHQNQPVTPTRQLIRPRRQTTPALRSPFRPKPRPLNPSPRKPSTPHNLIDPQPSSQRTPRTPRFNNSGEGSRGARTRGEQALKVRLTTSPNFDHLHGPIPPGYHYRQGGFVKNPSRSH